jgi:hypothetical protein
VQVVRFPPHALIRGNGWRTFILVMCRNLTEAGNAEKRRLRGRVCVCGGGGGVTETLAGFGSGSGSGFGWVPHMAWTHASIQQSFPSPGRRNTGRDDHVPLPHFV